MPCQRPSRAVGRDVQVLEVEPAPPIPGRKLVEEQRETDRAVIHRCDERLSRGIRPEQCVCQHFLGCQHGVGLAFICRKIADKFQDRRGIGFDCGANFWSSANLHMA